MIHNQSIIHGQSIMNINVYYGPMGCFKHVTANIRLSTYSFELHALLFMEAWNNNLGYELIMDYGFNMDYGLIMDHRLWILSFTNKCIESNNLFQEFFLILHGNIQQHYTYYWKSHSVIKSSAIVVCILLYQGFMDL